MAVESLQYALTVPCGSSCSQAEEEEGVDQLEGMQSVTQEGERLCRTLLTTRATLTLVLLEKPFSLRCGTSPWVR